MKKYFAVILLVCLIFIGVSMATVSGQPQHKKTVTKEIVTKAKIHKFEIKQLMKAINKTVVQAADRAAAKVTKSRIDGTRANRAKKIIGTATVSIPTSQVMVSNTTITASTNNQITSILPVATADTDITIDPDATQKIIDFSGYTWKVKTTSIEPWGPGPNYFSNYSSDIFVDDSGKLHMKIVQHNGKWYSTELITSQQMGYGTYRFYMDNDPNQIDPNAVLGLFTWDDNTFQSDANSEVDVEFSKWGDASFTKILGYSVQPTYSLNAFYSERQSLATFPTATPSITSFTWAQSTVAFDSQILQNDVYIPYKSWAFDGATNPARSSWNGVRFSDPVTVPKPSATTHAHINLWLQDLNKDGIGDAPSDGKEVEIVISKFEYVPSQ